MAAIGALPGACGQQFASVGGPGQRAQTSIGDACDAGRIGRLQRCGLQHGHGGGVRETHSQQFSVWRVGHIKRLAATGWAGTLQKRQPTLAHIVQTYESVDAGSRKLLAIRRVTRAIDFPVVLRVIADLNTCTAPLSRRGEKPDAMFAPQTNGERLTIGRKGQLGDGVGQSGNALNHGATGAVKQVNVVVGRLAADGNHGAVGSDG